MRVEMKQIVFTSLVIALFLTFALMATADQAIVKVQSSVHPSLILAEKPAIAFFAFGRIWYSLGDKEKALAFFQKASEIDPSFAPAHHNQGVLFFELGELGKAEESFKRAIEKDPQYASGYKSLGILYFQMRDFDNAIAQFSEYATLNHENAEANFDLAQSYVARFRQNEPLFRQDYADLENAQRYLKKAMEIDPSFPHAEKNWQVIEEILRARQDILAR